VGNVRLQVIAPRTVTGRIRALICYLRLDESDVVTLKYTAPRDFAPELQNCHFNIWVQCDKAGGEPQHGWLLAEDAVEDFAEAQFHTVWRSPDGRLLDMTPRADGEKRVMFVPDAGRSIQLSDHEGRPAIITYDNVRMYRGHLITELVQIKVPAQSEIIYEHGLAVRSRA
jgi:hypothetical protein